MKKILLLTGLMAGIASAAQAASSVQTTAVAQIVEPIAIINRTPLDFGFIIPSASSGTVTISPQNQRTATGNVTFGAGSFQRASFQVRGAPDRNYSIHTPATAIFTVSQQQGNDPSHLRDLTVQNFVTYSKNVGQGSTGKLGNNGEDEIYLGGTLMVPSNAAPGVYSGLVPLTVSY